MEFNWSTDEQLVEQLEAIPERLFFKIGEVAELVDLKPYVLRYWETEFECLNPTKSRNGQRVYTRKDVEIVFLIRKLLHKDRFSIEGARAAIARYGLNINPPLLVEAADVHIHQAPVYEDGSPETLTPETQAPEALVPEAMEATSLEAASLETAPVEAGPLEAAPVEIAPAKAAPVEAALARDWEGAPLIRPALQQLITKVQMAKQEWGQV